MPATLPTKSQINKAGDYLSKGVGLSRKDSGSWFDYERWTAARKTLSDWRAAHQRSLGNISQGLRQIVRSETGAPPSSLSG